MRSLMGSRETSENNSQVSVLFFTEQRHKKAFSNSQRRGFVAAAVQEVLSPAGTPGSSRKELQTRLPSLSSNDYCFNDYSLAKIPSKL